MPLSHIEHFLVATDDIDKTADWYCRVLGVKEVLHVTQSAKSAGDNQKKYLGRASQDTGTGTGALDHIAFRATGLQRMMAHLKSLGVVFNERRANGQALYQLFMFDPNGIKIELNYDAAEAAGTKAEVMASDFARN